MLKKTSLVILTLLCVVVAFSQQSISEFTSKNTNLYFKSTEEQEKRGIPSTVYEFNPAMLERVGEKYIIRLESKTPFTCFGIGWKTAGMNHPAGDFKINFALEKQAKDKTFGESKSAEGDVHPTETETGIYWSELMFGYDEDARKYLYLELIIPTDVQIEKIRIDVMDLSGDVGNVFNKTPEENTLKSGACPPAPTIIQRAQWCGTYTACTNASYTPTVINPTHVVMHHGASPDTYTDGYAVVRSYWNYHVNTLAWSDIGYNYLVDKFGNIFLGRKNANYLTQDVRGSHAGNSNGASIGVNFLGNGDVTQPTPIQLEKLYDLLGWWFNSRNINITSTANITLQSGGTANLQRFVGHKDVNIGGTACPGTVIYSLLPSIRTQVVSLINGCTSAPTTASNLQRTVGTCPQNNVSFSWSGSGSGWYIQISNSSSFTSPYIKYVSNLTSFTGPTGFVLQSDMTTPLTFSAGQTYYWRIFDNTSFVTGPSFTINSVPAQPTAITGTSSICAGSSSTYSIAAVTGATSYTWTVPVGSTITAGQGTTSITITTGSTAGNIAVSASNACGTGTTRTLAVTSNTVPAQPTAITGTSSVCAGSSSTYSIAAVTGATSYTWTVPAGSTITSGQGTTSITVTAGSTAGNIAVSASNACGTGTTRTLAVTSNAVPAQPTAITGTSSVCAGSSSTYSIATVTGATSYTWTVPAGSTITAGQGTTSITVTAGSTAGNIAVSASNACGTGTARTLAITLATCADVTRPTTNVTNPTWVTTDFTASFTDTDNTGGSGLKYRFYQVIDKNGNEWRANKNDGFFNDNFDGTAIHSDWNLISGTWSVASGILSQNDQANANSNLYFAMQQVTSSQYLYNWKMKISGTGTNRRAGLHFFCDNATLSNRGNSYMVFFRADGNVAQVYEYLNNTMYLRASAPCTVTPGVMYDYKVVLNPTTGEINVYQNDVFIISWTDTTPLTVGNHVSLRTADCAVEYDDIRILKSRTTTATVTAGNSTSKQIRFQNANSSSPSGKIVSIVTDIAKNISTESSSMVNLDFWGPFTVGTVNDGLAADIASQTSTTSLSANWMATSDANNTISHYSYAIGTSPGSTNIVSWTNNGLNLSFTRTGLVLTAGTTYYVSIRAHNIANLVSSVRSSNGVIISGTKMGEISESEASKFQETDILVYPNPASDLVYLNGADKDAAIEIIDFTGKLQNVEWIENEIPAFNVAMLPSGTYFIRVTQKGQSQFKKFIKK